ncbi:spermatogenesis-associated protein 48 [Protobothrops mucrosquamatus]|uniref:spermatogenesis-associated protein 48 n=1 Tax=Protobothrops mucrosquamatus TaxID=103944 RepID=UPI0010FB0AE1|nr:spermatogenesis-associated protein 48 [Protobothrops mucrosquamatus]
MDSQVTARHFHPYSCLTPIDSLHKMHLNQHKDLLKKMYMPFVRGPEDRHFFASFQEKDSNTFLKSNPFLPPEDKNYLLAPHRNDVPIINPCSGSVSPGGKVEQQILDNKAYESLQDGKDTHSSKQEPVFYRRVQTADRRSLFLKEINQDQWWNARAVADISVRSRLGGWTSPVKVIPNPPKAKENFLPHTFVFHVDTDVQSSDTSSEPCRDKRAQKYMYTSTIQRGYEEVPWDNMLSPKVWPAHSTLQPMVDISTSKRYEPAEEISQVVGGLWDRFQKRIFTVPYRPINFVSPNSRTQHLPSYTGCIGSENFEDLDNPYVDLITYNKVHTTMPHYVKSSHSPNTLGYTGKVHWSAIQPVNSNLPPTLPSIISRMYGYLAEHGQPKEFPHWGPLSQIVTTTEPQNSFNKREKERLTI